MNYTYNYYSPLGNLTMASNGQALTGLWFARQKYFGVTLPKEHETRELPVFGETKKWLEIYFQGKEPVGDNPIGIIVPCHRVVGATGSLTGYAGGIEKKEKLLMLEKEDKFF